MAAVSLILDALNRSRQDTDQVPGLATQHYVDRDMASGRNWRQYLPWLALLVALLVIGWLLFDRSPASPGVMPVTGGDNQLAPRPASKLVPDGAAPAPATEKVVPPAPSAVVNAPARPPPPVVAEQVAGSVSGQAPGAAAPGEPSRSAVADLYQHKQIPVAVAEQSLKQPVPEASRPAASQITSQVSKPAAAEAVEVATQEQPIDIEKLVLQARDDLEDATLQQHPAPFIASLSQQTKDTIPSIFYGRHNYSGTPSQSSVVLNNKAVKVGGSPAPGLKVDEILPDSVVLSYRGTQFRLRALNSWVNL